MTIAERARELESELNACEREDDGTVIVPDALMRKMRQLAQDTDAGDILTMLDAYKQKS